MKRLFILVTFIIAASLCWTSCGGCSESDRLSSESDSAALASLEAQRMKEEKNRIWSQQLHERLQAIEEKAQSANFTTALCIYDLTDDSLFSAFNEQKTMIPASTHKLLTSIAALHFLGKDHKLGVHRLFAMEASSKECSMAISVWWVVSTPLSVIKTFSVWLKR